MKLKFEKGDLLHLLMVLPMFESFISDGASIFIERGKIVYYVIFGLLVLLNLARLFNSFVTQKNTSKILTLLVLAASAIYSYYFHNGSLSFVADKTSLYFIFFYCWVYFVAAQAIPDYKKLFRWFVGSAKLNIILGVYTYFRLVQVLSTTPTTHNATWGYFITFCTALVLFDMISNRRVTLLNIILVIAGSYMCLSVGSRGSFVALLITLLFGVFLIFQAKRTKLILSEIVLIALIVLVSRFYTDILQFVSSLLGNIGIHSRTVNALIDNTFVFDTARTRLYTSARLALSAMPFPGYGLMGDRMFADGFYVHNILYEFLLQYGYWIGGALLTIIAGFLIKAIFNPEKRLIVLSIALVYIPMLSVSSSYLQLVYFWILIGIAMQSKRKKFRNAAVEETESTQQGVKTA